MTSKRVENKSIKSPKISFDVNDISDLDALSKLTKLTIRKKNVRTVMYLEDDPAKPVTAGGVLIYKNINNKMKLLVIENNGKYEDIGGKIDADDSNIFSAVAREVQEETNSQIEADSIIERLENADYIYVAGSKYVIYIVEASDSEKKLRKKDFGDREEHDDFPRTIGWLSREELTKPAVITCKMNWRIRTKTLFDKLSTIEKSFKFSKKLFKSEPKSESELSDDSC